MSFTAQVKDELSRIDGASNTEVRAELSAIVRLCGTLSFQGSGTWALRAATETGAVARTIIKRCHELYNLETPLTVRRSNLHRTHNFLIEIRNQENLEYALLDLGIIEANQRGRSISPSVPKALLTTPGCQKAYLRGAFMAGGFVSDPRGDFHLEIAFSSEQLAQDICALAANMGVPARVNHRRSSYVVYLKRYESVVAFLELIGAVRMAEVVRTVRERKHVKNEVNRRVNAELANSHRASDAATNQALLIERAERIIGLRGLPPTLRELCILRRSHPELSLSDLGSLCNPPVGKSAMHHRVQRLAALVEEAEGKQG